jgi:hypothetical protein
VQNEDIKMYLALTATSFEAVGSTSLTRSFTKSLTWLPNESPFESLSEMVRNKTTVMAATIMNHVSTDAKSHSHINLFQFDKRNFCFTRQFRSFALPQFVAKHQLLPVDKMNNEISQPTYKGNS